MGMKRVTGLAGSGPAGRWVTLPWTPREAGRRQLVLRLYGASMDPSAAPVETTLDVDVAPPAEPPATLGRLQEVLNVVWLPADLRAALVAQVQAANTAALAGDQPGARAALTALKAQTAAAQGRTVSGYSASRVSALVDALLAQPAIAAVCLPAAPAAAPAGTRPPPRPAPARRRPHGPPAPPPARRPPDGHAGTPATATPTATGTVTPTATATATAGHPGDGHAHPGRHAGHGDRHGHPGRQRDAARRRRTGTPTPPASGSPSLRREPHPAATATPPPPTVVPPPLTPRPPRRRPPPPGPRGRRTGSTWGSSRRRSRPPSGPPTATPPRSAGRPSTRPS